MALCINTSSCSYLIHKCNFELNLKKNLRETHVRRLSSWLNSSNNGVMFKVKASCDFNPTNQPILKEALKEPVAFMGGMFAGLLRLDLEEEPLKEWVTRTVEASGITVEDIDAEGSQPEEVQQIDIE